MCLAIPTQITTIDDNQMATVVLGGVERQISLVMTPEAQIGDYVLVHTGYSITIMSQEEAQASLEAFAELAGKDPVAYRLELLGEPRKLAFSDMDQPYGLDTGRLSRVIEGSMFSQSDSDGSARVSGWRIVAVWNSPQVRSVSGPS